MIITNKKIHDWSWKVMARQTFGVNSFKNDRTKKITGQGDSVRTSIKNKNKRRMKKKYIGQGK